MHGREAGRGCGRGRAAGTGDLAMESSGAVPVLAEYPPQPPVSDTILRIGREQGAACDLVSAMSACANADMRRVAAGCHSPL